MECKKCGVEDTENQQHKCSDKQTGSESPSVTGLCDALFTEEDLETCWPAYQTYLVEILNGEYSLNDAREDLRGLIGSKYDPRESI